MRILADDYLFGGLRVKLFAWKNLIYLFFCVFQAVIEKLNLSDGAAECFYLFETVEYNFGK